MTDLKQLHKQLLNKGLSREEARYYIEANHCQQDEIFFQEGCIHIDELLGKGLASNKGVKEDDVSPEELAVGIQTEMKHTIFPRIAKRVALDNIAQMNDYYSRQKPDEFVFVYRP